VAGLTRAIEKARGAVAQSEANAKQLGEKSAQASSPSAAGTPASAAPGSTQPASPSSPGASARPSTSKPATHVGSAAPARTHSTTHTAPTHTAPTHTAPTHKHASTRANTRSGQPLATRSGSTPAAQQTVEADLRHGKVVAILFWDPHGVVDQVAQKEIQAVGQALRGRLAVLAAKANQVGAFGSFTRAVQVYGTPTILIVNRRGRTTSLSGLTDRYSLEQAIGEATR
jgi:hypothetical protein